MPVDRRAKIEAAAARKFADEYDAAQERGEVGQSGVRSDLVPNGNEVAPSAADLGLSRKDINEARQVRDAEAKASCRHGEWLPWLESEFGWSDQTARKFMHVAGMADKFKSDLNFDLPIGSLYALAAPSTPEPARAEAIARAETGETPAHGAPFLSLTPGPSPFSATKITPADSRARCRTSSVARRGSEAPFSNWRTVTTPTFA